MEDNLVNILLVSPIPPNASGAGAIPVLLHAQIAAMRHHHDVKLVTVAGPDPGDLDAADRISELGIESHVARRTNPEGFDRWRRRWRFGSSWLTNQVPWRTVWFFEPEVQSTINRLLARYHFDVIHVEDNAAGVYSFPEDVPKLLTEHEVRRPRPIDWRGWNVAQSAQWALSEADWRRWRSYQPSIWRRFDRIQVFTSRDADSILEVAPDLDTRVTINPFPVSIPSKIRTDQEQVKTLLFVGDFTHPPNVDAALWLGLEIMPLLRARTPGVRLLLVGPHAPDNVRSLACDDIAVTGRVTELAPYLAEAAVVIAPIRIGGGMRMKVLQAMAHGKAVVTTPRGASGLCIDGDRAPLMVADDAVGIADATTQLLSSVEARRELGQRARDFACRHFGSEAYVERLGQVYRGMLADRQTE